MTISIRRAAVFISFLWLITSYQNCFVMKDSRQVPTSGSAGASNAPLSGAGAPGAFSVIPLAGNFSSLDVNVFQPKCLVCHSQPAPAGNYDMSDYTQISTRVVPTNPSSSLLYQRVSDGSMPPGAPLSSAEIQAVSAWITNGGLNDGPPLPAQPSPSPVTPTPTFGYINAYIIQKNCAACHSAGQSDDFNSTDYASILRSVVPGNSAQSKLYDVIQSGEMPPYGALPSSDVQLIKTWIDDGALDN